MNKLKHGLIAGAVGLACSGAAHAAPVFQPGMNEVFFENVENQYRSELACAAVPGSCLANAVGDPVGFDRINPAIAGNVAVGDIFIGILSVQNIKNSQGFDIYNASPGNFFTGYFVQEVKAIAPPAGGHSTAHITLGTTADPFGILAAGEMFRFYSDTASYTTGGGTDITTGRNLATSGTFWGSLGLSAPPDGYAYTHTDLTVTVNTSNTEAFLAVDLITKGPGYNAGLLAKINDFTEAEIGGTTAAPLLCSPAEIASPTISCTDFAGTSEIEPNTGFALGSSPWMYASNDPFRLFQVPEPGTLALVGFALAALGLRRRRMS